MASNDHLTGGCQCGAIRYEIMAPPHETYICHCTECRQQSSSAFGISVIVGIDDLKLKAGEPKCWSRSTDRGVTLNCYFCPECGSRVWHKDRIGAKTVSVKGGSLDNPVDLTGVAHIWTRSKLPGLIIPNDAPQFPQEPDDERPRT